MDKFELLSSDTWSSLSKRTKTHNSIKAAIAYVTTDNLNLKRGDLLVCDASDRAIRGGLTDAEVLSKYHKKGVSLHSLQGLHAKVAVIDGSTFIGSANMSATAGIRTKEASLFTDNLQVAGLTLEFIESVIAHPDAVAVDKTFIQRIRKLEVNRPFPMMGLPGTEKVVTPAPPRRPGTASSWFIHTTPFTPRQEVKETEVVPKLAKRVEALLRKRKDKAAAALAEQIAADPDSLAYVRTPKRSRIAQGVKKGDVVLICTGKRGGNRFTVEAPAAVLYIEDDGQFVRICHTPILEHKEYAWSKVNTAFKKLGVTKIKPTSSVELKGDAGRILEFFKQK